MSSTTDPSGPAASAPAAQPSITVPKGGGAIRSIGEKFAANPVTGTGTMTVPLPTSPARSGFGAPTLALTYDSGAGNGPFGIGWRLALPAITRKTDKGLPSYADSSDSDVFVLSDFEDLVPVLDEDGRRRSEESGGFAIERYRPRVEGQFPRIERWTALATGDVHWRSVTGDNVTTLYGVDESSRIVDARSGERPRVFSWLICETYDDKGNAIAYEYAGENDANVDRSTPPEQHRDRTTNRYLKRILYGNRVSRLAQPDLRRPPSWMFETVFDYDEEHLVRVPLDPGRPEEEQHRYVDATSEPRAAWAARRDAFSSFRAGFEVRTHRRCRRVLLFHHIPDAPDQPGFDGLVRATELEYDDLDAGRDPAIEEELAHQGSSRFGSFLRRVVQSGYSPHPEIAGRYLEKSFPPTEFEYSKPSIQDEVRVVDERDLLGIPAGVDGTNISWVDLHGEGLTGLLTEQASAWFYKRNLSGARLGPPETVPTIPNLSVRETRAQFADLAGDGRADIVLLEGTTPGWFEHDDQEGWEPFRPFPGLPRPVRRAAQLHLADLDGDGLADILLFDDDGITWHRSLGEHGFASARRIAYAVEEPATDDAVVVRGTESVHLADMAGDGMVDFVRIRNGEVKYRPNLGHGRFGPTVTMDNAPWFDEPDHFDQSRIRLVDIDGSGTTDIVYLHRDGPRLYLNQSGNRISDPRRLTRFPRVDNVAAVAAVDLLGNGTACLVWSSPLPGDAGRPLRYVDLTGGTKPHLLTRSRNNLGAETRIEYAPSTTFYLDDLRDGRPWATRLPFPVHVVSRVVTHDWVSGNQFVTRYAYHDGYFDPHEREFRGFGMVEQWDTETYETLTALGLAGQPTNVEASSHVPPVLTRTWFHTGAATRRPAPTGYGSDALSPSTPPPGLSAGEEREAIRALRGSVLRQEVYGLDGSAAEPHPYSVTEHSFAVRVVQRRGTNRHAVFYVHPRESLSQEYERAPSEPRVKHVMTLAVDAFGNVLESVSIGYGRRRSDPGLPPLAQAAQARTLAMYTENRVTNAVDTPDAYRTPAICESRTFDLTGIDRAPGSARLSPGKVAEAVAAARPLTYHAEPTPGQVEKRLVDHVRTYYRRDDFTGALPLGSLEPLGLFHENYRLAMTPDTVARVYGDSVDDQAVSDAGYVHTAGDDDWWIPSGRVFYSPGRDNSPAAERAHAEDHFYMPRRYRDAFGNDATVAYDPFDLLLQETRDPLGNTVTVAAQDYRVLQPAIVLDANRNRVATAFDALGIVVGTAVMGKPPPAPVEGDSLTGLRPDLTKAEVDAFFAEPRGPAARDVLGDATVRTVYDMTAATGQVDTERRAAPVAGTISRETHVSDLPEGVGSALQVWLSYSDGFGREIQKKSQAAPGPVPGRDGTVAPRWVATGWVVLNNKGIPVRRYEPFYTDTHRFELDFRNGVSPVIFYDPLGRSVATLHPNHSWQKTVYQGWREEAWDVNDTTGIPDPGRDEHVGDHIRRLPPADYLPTWHELRTAEEHERAFVAAFDDADARRAEREAAIQARRHAGTPVTSHLDALGRSILTITHNRAFDEDELAFTVTVMDIEGNEREVVDAKGRVAARYSYDVLGNRVQVATMDSGVRRALLDAAGKPVREWDARGNEMRTSYDALRRLVEVRLIDALGREAVVERIVYGESTPDPDKSNSRKEIVEVRDQAGIVTSDGFDFKGNLLRSRRRLAASYDQLVDWSADPVLETEAYSSSTAYDALNRVVQSVPPHSDAEGTVISALQPSYNETNLVQQVHAWLDRTAVPDFLLDTATADLRPVADLDYDAKGQRTVIEYGNGARTTYTYDRLTYRLARLVTGEVQDLRYTYDAVGNVTQLRDEAQQAVFFRNARVEPTSTFEYDALYRLVEATGREHLGQLDGMDPPDVPTLHPGDGNAMARYRERYRYDVAGSLLEVRHRGGDAAHPGWTRSYEYEEPSRLDADVVGTRLTRTRLGSTVEDYAGSGDGYDQHGNMTRMPHLADMAWDYADRLRSTTRQATTHPDAAAERTWYVYDSAGERVRKVTERCSGTVHEERLYLGGFEIYRKPQADALVRETLHLVHNDQRVGLVETRTVGDDGSPERLVRYHLANHLGSVSVELDEGGSVISYEEYSPYGATTYRAVATKAFVSKRYRFTGKERDDETGFGYHGARYYSPWLGVWTSADPAYVADVGSSDGHPYAYARGNPVNAVDPDGTLVWLLGAAIVIAVVATPQIANAPAPGERTYTKSVSELALEMAENAAMIYGAARLVVALPTLVAGEGVLVTGGTLARQQVVGEIRGQAIQQTANLVDPTGTLGRVANLADGPRGGGSRGTGSRGGSSQGGGSHGGGNAGTRHGSGGGDGPPRGTAHAGPEGVTRSPLANPPVEHRRGTGQQRPVREDPRPTEPPRDRPRSERRDRDAERRQEIADEFRDAQRPGGDHARLADRGVQPRTALPQSPQHHLIPRELVNHHPDIAAVLRRERIDIDAFTVKTRGHGEHSAVHSGGALESYNRRWLDFFARHRATGGPNRRQILGFMHRMRRLYRVHDLPIERYEGTPTRY